MEYAKEELRVELASVFLMAEHGIPHHPDSHAAYLGSWLKALRDDKHEIFRAARDAHRTADLLIALELYRSIDRALTYVNKLQVAAPSRIEAGVIVPLDRGHNPMIEMEF